MRSRLKQIATLRLCSCFVASLSILTTAALHATTDEKDYERAERFGSTRMGRLAVGGRVEPHWIEDTPRFWYRREQRDSTDIVLVDATTGEKTEGYRPNGEDKRHKQDTETKRERRIVVEKHNLYRVDNGERRPLTTDGSAHNRYAIESWAPDGSRLLATRTRPGANREMHVIQSRPGKTIRPVLKSHVYDLPGDALAVQTLHIFDVDDGKHVPVKNETIDWWGPHHVNWDAAGTSLTYVVTHRGFQRRRLVRVDTRTGKACTLIDERSDTFLPPTKALVQYLHRRGEVIWSSERDGWHHLYLFGLETGKLKHRVTQGKWVVRGIEHVDEESGEIWFTASGREPGRDPYLVHYYRAKLDGSDLTLLTRANGDHEAVFSPDYHYLVDTYSRVDAAAVCELRDGRSGRLVCELERMNVNALLETAWRWPEPFHAKGRDGRTDIWGVIFRPSNLDPGREYPVIECIYAGPHGAFVPKRFIVHSEWQAMAELGFIVVQIDGMGTSNRSKAFQDVAHKNLADGGFPDRIAWLKATADRYPYIDISRVGIYGTSAGGYNAARALIDHGDFYSVAVSICGNHDHRTDKVWWNELWMGYPVGEHYRQQSNVECAHRLRGKLLLAHGELDTNVNPYASTMQFADALIRANKDFDFLLYPGKGHGLNTPYFTRRMWDHFVRHLHGVDPPHEYRMKLLVESEPCHITVRNAWGAPVKLYWLTHEGGLKLYRTLEPGEVYRQHTFFGHDWEAHASGLVVSRFTATQENLNWTIGREPCHVTIRNATAEGIDIPPSARRLRKTENEPVMSRQPRCPN